jgi:hypothetical protein
VGGEGGGVAVREDGVAVREDGVAVMEEAPRWGRTALG